MLWPLQSSLPALPSLSLCLSLCEFKALLCFLPPSHLQSKLLCLPSLLFHPLRKMLEKQKINRQQNQINGQSHGKQQKQRSCVCECVCVAAYHKMFNKTQLLHCPLPLSLSLFAPSIMLYMSHSGICPSQHWNGPKTLWKWFKIFLLTAAQNVFLPLSFFLSLTRTRTHSTRRKRSVRLLIIKQSLKRNSISVIRNETLRTQHWTGQQTSQTPLCSPPPPTLYFFYPSACCLWSFGKIFKAVWPKDANKSKWKKGCRTMCGMCRICFCKELCVCMSESVCGCVCVCVWKCENDWVWVGFACNL